VPARPPAPAAASVQLQLEEAQCLSWLKEGTLRHGSSIANGKIRKACGTGEKVGHCLAVHWDHACSPQPCLAVAPCPMAMIAAYLPCLSALNTPLQLSLPQWPIGGHNLLSQG
jgi:hypothetical protein